MIPLLAYLGNPSKDKNLNFSRCIAKTQTLSIPPLLASLGNPSEDKTVILQGFPSLRLFLNQFV